MIFSPSTVDSSVDKRPAHKGWSRNFLAAARLRFFQHTQNRLRRTILIIAASDDPVIL
jgi:hypothetical protein